MPRMTNDELVTLLDLSKPRIWRDRDGKEGCKCFRCAKPIRTIVEVPVRSGGLQKLGLDCFLLLKGAGRGKTLSPKAEIQVYMEDAYRQSVGEPFALDLTTKNTRDGSFYFLTINGEPSSMTSPVRHGVEAAVTVARNVWRELAWIEVEEEWKSLTGSAKMPRDVYMKTPVAMPSGVVVDGMPVEV